MLWGKCASVAKKNFVASAGRSVWAKAAEKFRQMAVVCIISVNVYGKLARVKQGKGRKVEVKSQDEVVSASVHCSLGPNICSLAMSCTAADPPQLARAH